MTNFGKVKDSSQLSVDKSNPPSDEYKLTLVKTIVTHKDPAVKLYTIEMMQRLSLIDVKVQTEFAQVVKDEGLKRKVSLPLINALMESINTPELLTDIQGMNINRTVLEVVGQRIDALSKLQRK